MDAEISITKMVGLWNWIESPLTSRGYWAGLGIGLLLITTPVLGATDTTDAICNNALMSGLNSMVTFASVVVPGIALLSFMASMGALSWYTQPDKKRVWKERRSKALIYGTLATVAGQIFSLAITFFGGSVADCVSYL